MSPDPRREKKNIRHGISQERAMPPGAMNAATRLSRKTPSTSGLPAGAIPDYGTEETIDICLDNDLGAECTGTIDCIERVLRNRDADCRANDPPIGIQPARSVSFAVTPWPRCARRQSHNVDRCSRLLSRRRGFYSVGEAVWACINIYSSDARGSSHHVQR